MTKNEFIEKIVYLNSQFCKRPDDYTKERVKIHNKAAKKLNVIENALCNDIEMATLVYGELMDSEDNFTRSNAAAWSLELKINTEKAIKVLKNLKKHGDEWEAMGAERLLKIWRGEIGPDDPF